MTVRVIDALKAFLRRSSRILLGYAATCLAALLAVTPAAAQVCAPPGAFQTGPTSGVVNTYYAAASGSTLNIGATSMTVGTASGYDPTNPVVGDLLLASRCRMRA